MTLTGGPGDAIYLRLKAEMEAQMVTLQQEAEAEKARLEGEARAAEREALKTTGA